MKTTSEPQPDTARKLAIAAVALLVVLLIGFILAWFAHRHREQQARAWAQQTLSDKPVVEAVAVQPSAGVYALKLPGSAAGWYESTIFARVDGYVQSWLKDIGDHVKAGEVLAVIETPELDQQLNAARAKAAADEAQVQVAASNLSFARLTYDRWRDSPAGVVSEQERQEKKADFDQANARYLAAQAQVNLDQADVARYVDLEEFKKVIAPYDGVITSRRVDIGDLVSAGSSANTSSLYTIAQSNVIRVFVDVPQGESSQMTVGLSADATVGQLAGRVFRGKVARTALSIDPQTRTLRTEVDIPNPDFALLPGMYVEVTFQLKQPDLPVVPAAAILMRPGGLAVAIVTQDNTVHFSPVTVAKDDGDTVILSTGVRPGDRVALNLSSAVTDGETVLVNEDNPGKKQ